MSSSFGFLGGFAMVTMTEHDALLRAVGEGLTMWGRVETGLFRIFHEAIHCPALRPSSAAFIAVESFRAKLGMTDATLRSSRRFRPHIKEWERLQTRCISESKERNRLAHSTVFLLQVGTGKPKALLGSYEHDMNFLTARGRPDQRKLKNISNLKQIQNRFFELGSDLNTFARKIHQP